MPHTRSAIRAVSIQLIVCDCNMRSARQPSWISHWKAKSILLHLQSRCFSSGSICVKIQFYAMFYDLFWASISIIERTAMFEFGTKWRYIRHVVAKWSGYVSEKRNDLHIQSQHLAQCENRCCGLFTSLLLAIRAYGCTHRVRINRNENAFAEFDPKHQILVLFLLQLISNKQTSIYGYVLLPYMNGMNICWVGYKMFS